MRSIQKLFGRGNFCNLFTKIFPLLIGVVMVGGLLVGAQPASAQVAGCIQDVWKAHGNNQKLTCTANDVTLSEVTNICVHDGLQYSAPAMGLFYAGFMRHNYCTRA